MKENDSDQLTVIRCNGCHKLFVPPRYHCSGCGKSDFCQFELTGKGEVYSYTIIRVPFEEFLEEAPYAFAEVRLEEGLVVPGRFTNEKDRKVKVGSRVSFVRKNRGVNWFELV